MNEISCFMSPVHLLVVIIILMMLDRLEDSITAETIALFIAKFCSPIKMKYSSWFVYRGKVCIFAMLKH